MVWRILKHLTDAMKWELSSQERGYKVPVISREHLKMKGQLLLVLTRWLAFSISGQHVARLHKGGTMGSVFKKKDTWYIRYDLPPGLDGQRRQIAKSCTGMTKKEAKHLLNEIEATIVRGEYQQPSSHTVATYLEEWLVHTLGVIGENTFANYSMVVHKHLIPGLGTIKLDQLTPLQIQRYYATLQQPGSNRNSTRHPRALSPKTIKNIHGIFHRALAQAVRWGVRSTNPADAVDIPKQTRSKIKAATPDELLRIMAAIDDAGVWRIPLLITLGTGMRRGEVLALQWQDYNPEAKTLIVQRTSCQITESNVILKGTKTDRARVVLVNDSLAKELNRHQEQTPYSSPTDWICGRTDGSHHTPRHLTRAFESIVNRLGVKITLHGLRHSHATTLIAEGVPVKVVSERLGHSTVVITQDTYAHVLPHMQRQAADVTEMLWQKRPTSDDSQPEQVKECAAIAYYGTQYKSHSVHLLCT